MRLLLEAQVAHYNSFRAGGNCDGIYTQPLHINVEG
jgi:hypothetical protein